MSLRRPPSRPGRHDPRDPDASSIDLAPDEAIDGATLDDLEEFDELDELEDQPASPTTIASGAPHQRTDAANGHRATNKPGNGESVNRPRDVRNGRGAAVAEPETVEDDGLREPEIVEPVARPVAVAAAPVTPVAYQGTSEELTLGAWLQRRWLYGLTYWQTALLVFLFVALLLTRFFNLGDRAMHHDESMHAKFAWDTFRGQVYKYNPLLHGPFQFLSVAGSFWLFGATEWTARAVPAIFGVALVCLTFLWRRWLGTAGWLFAAAIFTFSPSFTYFSRMLREDSYTATWTLLAATGLVGYVLHRKRPWFYAFCVGLAFAFATKESTYITAFIFGTYMIVSVLWERVGPTQRRMLAGACAGAIVLAYWSSVMGNFKKELFEVGGAVVGLLLGAAGGFVYDQLRPTGRLVDAAAGRRPEVNRTKRRAGMTAVTATSVTIGAGRADGTRRRWGTFTDAFVNLWQDRDGFWGVGTFWGGVIVFFAIFIVLFSSFFTNIPGVREGLIGSIQYWLEQHGVQRGNQPWFYYLLILSVYETLPWLFGIAATVYYLRPGRSTWLTTFLIWWWVVALTIYSWAGEKMPWLIIHMATPLVLLTARYLGELVTSAGRSVWEKRVAYGALAVLGLWTIHTGWPANFERPDTPKDLLIYTQTAPDAKKVMADIQRISLEQTGQAQDIGVVVQSGTWWPFSWYLRDFKNAEYPANLAAQATKPIVLVAGEDLEKNRPFLQGYSGTKYKMRWWYPEDYRNLKASSFVELFTKKDVRDGLWKWLVYRETTQPLGSYDFYVYMKDGLGPTTAAGAAGAVVDPSGAQRPPSQRVDPAIYQAQTVPLNVVAAWGQTGRNAGQLNTPRGVALDAQGNVYVADTLNHRIQKFSRTGQPIASWGTEGTGDGQFKEPMGVAVDRDGNVYVADTWNHRVQKLDANGRFVAKWGGGTEFWGPRAVAIDGQGNVYVTDTGNKRIRKFDNSGRVLGQYGSEGSGPGQFREPVGLAVTPDGQMYVADRDNRRIQHLDAGGRFVMEWPFAGWQSGARTEPYLALDADGNVLATDPSGGRIVKFAPNGEVLAAGGTPGKANGQFDTPLGIAVGDAIYVVDSGNHRVQAVAFGQ